MAATEHTFTGEVNIFPGPSGWVYVRVPTEITRPLKSGRNFGMIPMTVMVGETSWKTQLMPMGDGNYFVALNARVRKKEYISIGDTITVTYKLT
jgi:hypothetical protein